MELDWSTFLLEIVNFLVLAWLLKHFLFQPVLRVIGERQTSLESIAERTRDKERAAAQLVEDYNLRLSNWDKEREGLRLALREELRADRERLSALLARDLEDERTRQRTVADKAARDAAMRIEAAAVSNAVAFATRLLRRIAGPALEAKLIGLAIEDLQSAPVARRSELAEALADGKSKVHVATAYPMPEEAKTALRTAISSLGRLAAEFTYTSDPGLIAGLRLSIGPWTLRANLADELQAFSDAAGIAL